jgi:predicted MFS family arabinose efflux permease
MRLALVVFCPFAAGYFLSFFFRNVNAVISRDLAREFSLSPSDLGFLTSMYLLAFAAIQLPLGVLLDRYGPRRVVAALLCVCAAGALTFAVAQDFVTLSIGRALIGFGVSAGLMGAIKAFTLWFPLSRLATVNGLYLGIGGLGALSATAPAEAVLSAFGWRALFFGMAAITLAAALAIFTVVPEKRLPGAGESLRAQFAGYGRVFRSLAFWRISTAFVICQATYLALQGLWLAPWLYDVAELDRAGVARHLFVTALAYTAGSVFFGVGGDWLARSGVPHMATFKAGLTASLALFGLVAAGVSTGLPMLLAAYGFSAISGSLAYPLFAKLFPAEMIGRVSTASNGLMFAMSFAFQWGIGAVLKLYPVVDGRYAPQGYAVAFFILAALQGAALLWLFRFSEGSSRTQPSRG